MTDPDARPFEKAGVESTQSKHDFGNNEQGTNVDVIVQSDGLVQVHVVESEVALFALRQRPVGSVWQRESDSKTRKCYQKLQAEADSDLKTTQQGHKAAQ